MNISTNINLKSLEAFTTIMETGSATKAASMLGLTQPGVSRQLANFEELIGFQLFYRENSRLLPTDEAWLLYEEVIPLLKGANRLTELAQNLFNSDIGTLKVVAPSSFITGPLNDIVAKFLIDRPGVSFSIDTRSPAAARELISRRSVDCGFLQMPEEHPGIDCHHLSTSQAVCVVHRSHPLSTLSEIHMSDLARHKLIVLGKGQRSRERIEKEFRKLKKNMTVSIEAHTVAVACSFAKSKLGVALVNGLLAKQYIDEELVVVPLVPTINYQYGFATAKQGKMSRLTRTFYDFCLAEFENMNTTQ